MPGRSTEDADVVVVGAGPAGAVAAHDLASTGLDVVLVDKAGFPREKVCGDGLTPRSVRQLVRLGVDTSEQAGWVRNKGLRIIGAGMRFELPWPALASFPDYGLVRPRLDLDELLVRTAVKAGARLYERTTVREPLVDRTDRVIGVLATDAEGRPVRWRAPAVVAADGVSARFALGMGIRRRPDRPMGVAVRRYYRGPRHDDDHLESWLELWDGPPGTGDLLPGYGWVFGMGDGTSNVGLGILNTSDAFGRTDYRSMLERWVAGFPAEWEMSEDTAVGPVRGAALPMGFNRAPLYSRGVLLTGDACGAINPFNGEGIAYAMESAALAAEVVAQGLARRDALGRERAFASYAGALSAAYGGYFALGRQFVHLIGHPSVMTFAARHGLPHPTLMRFLLKLLANLTDPGGDAMDRIINALVWVAAGVERRGPRRAAARPAASLT
jgi:geranylgeranyl reductase family protein